MEIMKILEFTGESRNIMEIIKFIMKIMEIIKIIRFQTIIMKTMKIIEFYTIITKIINNHRDPCNNNENHETLRIACENYEKSRNY